MKVLLIAPPYLPHSLRKVQSELGIPLGLAYIASVLEANNVAVKVLDLNLSSYDNWDFFDQRLAEIEPDVVGITAMTMNHPIAMNIAERIKRYRRDITIVMGGIHPSLAYDSILKNPSIDFVVYGEGEFTFLELIENIQKGRETRCINGLAFRTNGENIVVTPPRPKITQLDSLPLPARHLFFEEGGDTGYIASIITSRGCPYRCSFCSTARFHGRKLRTRNPEKVVEEIKQLIETYALDGVSFSDDIFTIDRTRTINLSKKIKEQGLNIKWGCLTRVDCVDLELLEIMREAGCEHIFYGIESVSQEALDRAKKGFTVEQAKKAVTWTKEAGISVIESFIIGLPSETYESALKIADFVAETEPSRVVLNTIMPFPGTELYNNLEQLGLRVIGNMSRSEEVVLPLTESETLSWTEIIKLRVELESAFSNGISHEIRLPEIELE